MMYVLVEDGGRESCYPTLPPLDTGIIRQNQLILWDHCHVKADRFQRDSRFEHDLGGFGVRVDIELRNGSYIANTILCQAVGSAHYHKFLDHLGSIWEAGE